MKKDDTNLAEKGYDVMGKCASIKEPYAYPVGKSPLFWRLNDSELGLYLILSPTDIMPFREEP